MGFARMPSMMVIYHAVSYMYRYLFHTETGHIIISSVLGFALAAAFHKTCHGERCDIVVPPHVLHGTWQRNPAPCGGKDEHAPALTPGK